MPRYRAAHDDDAVGLHVAAGGRAPRRVENGMEHPVGDGFIGKFAYGCVLVECLGNGRCIHSLS